jgi:2',3'-cyclic-nucleotide 2'-phosphodiesterase (5'-nucleotidase family)
VDAAVMNGGGIRTDRIVPAGPLTLGELMAWSPFGNLVVAVETDGASLRKYITKESLASCGVGVVEKNGYFVHPAGFRYTFQCTGSKQGQVSQLQWLNHPTKSGDIADDEPLTLALSNFLFSSEFATISGVTVGKMVVTEAEAKRADAALEMYVRAQTNGVLCPSTTTDPRAAVSF